jgi:hypothetical protein
VCFVTHIAINLGLAGSNHQSGTVDFVYEMIMNKLKLRLCVSMVLAVLRTRVDAQYDKDRRVLEPHPGTLSE